MLKVSKKLPQLKKQAGVQPYLVGQLDSSGVYIQFRPSGAGYGGQPAGTPVYKLLVSRQEPNRNRPTFVDGTPLDNQ